MPTYADLVRTYDYRLVALSVFVAILDAYVAIRNVLAIATPKIEIVTQLDPLSPPALVDVAALESALSNLFVNAREVVC
jgi:hypothetical protein